MKGGVLATSESLAGPKPCPGDIEGSPVSGDLLFIDGLVRP
jgi:hypothetical protein